MMFDRVFSWKNVPKILTVFAVISSGVTIWGLADPDGIGRQPITLPFMIVCTAVWWFAVYWTGTRKTRVKEDEEPTIKPPVEQPSVMPDFQEYMAAEEWEEKHPSALPTAVPPRKGSHKYDARV